MGRVDSDEYPAAGIWNTIYKSFSGKNLNTDDIFGISKI
jgi:hypothetical protein